jgi:hypothetical protein
MRALQDFPQAELGRGLVLEVVIEFAISADQGCGTVQHVGDIVVFPAVVDEEGEKVVT